VKKFLVHSAFFLTLVLGSIYWIFSQADGYTDPFYARFTTPQQQSLIIGTSKAAQGIRPDALKKVLEDHSIFNYAFTVAHSPYGPAYLKGIKRKLSEKTTDGIFIVTVDAWSIADSGEDPNDETQFDENKSFLNNLGTVSAKPNIPYLLSYYKNSYAKIFERDTIAFLHDDGWFEISVNMNSEIVDQRIKNKSASLKKKRAKFRFSQTRLSYLYKTIVYLQEHGEVYLVRLPVHPNLTEVDTAVIPEFDNLMSELSQKTEVPYLDLSGENENYTYTDGIHLYKDSAAEVSRSIALWIEQNSSNNVNQQ
jgi:hypothetical protein